MVLAEKIVTALQRGSASTRWRDFGDIFTITGRLTFKAGDLRQALQAVAQYRTSNSPTLMPPSTGMPKSASPGG